MPHKSPENKALVSSNSDTQKEEHWMSLTFAMDDMFRDNVSVDLFLKALGSQTDESDLNAYNGKTDAFLIDGSRQWKFALTTVLT